MILLLFILHLINILLIKSYEIPRMNSNNFLKHKSSFETSYEELRETTEAKRESCLNEYQQKINSYQRRYSLSPFCTQYCNETMDCQQNKEQPACINPLWPSRMIKYVQKFERMCYIRITEVVRYEQAERICQKYGLQLAIIDNIRLLEQLKQLNMFNVTCKGQCPRAKGYYIGLKRLSDENNQLESKWIWSNNVTWTQNETDCDDYSNTSYANASLLCYMENDGEKKVTVWNKGEPNNYHKGEQCVEIIASTTGQHMSSLDHIGKLNDIPCNKPTLGVICQVEDDKPINSTRFEYFATIIGFNKTENNLLSNLQISFPMSLNEMATMTEKLQKLLLLPSFTTEQAVTILNTVDQLVNITGQIQVEDDSLKSITNKLLQFLDLFPEKIEIENGGNLTLNYENMNMSVVEINFEEEVNEWFSINNQEMNSDVIIEINLRVLQKQFNEIDNHRIIETIFSNFNLFPQKNLTHYGIPISYQIANKTTIKTEENLIRFQIRVPESLQLFNYSCVYWSFDENNGSWINDNSCQFIGYINNYAQCYCNHLTHFALLILFESEQSLSITEELILTFVTYIGICLSIFGLIMTLITYALFRRSQRNHLHGSLIMLCLSILFVNCLYIPFNFPQQNFLCNIFGFLLHYFFLASFMWMLIMTIVQYMHFVRIFNTHISYFFIKTCLIGWIIPFIFPCFVILFGSNGGYIGEHRCWINSQILLYLTFLIPIFFIIICNVFLFGFILKSIFQRNITTVNYQTNHWKLPVGAALCCFVSIGCTWFFGIIVLLKPNFVNQLIFCVCNCFQGFLIFLFHVYLSKPKRELWQTFCMQHILEKQSQTSSGHTDTVAISNSSGTITTCSVKLHIKQ